MSVALLSCVATVKNSVGLNFIVPQQQDVCYIHTSARIFALAVVCFIITMCWWVIGLLPAIVLCGRYFYSRRVIHGYLEHAMSTDMGDIEGFYMKSPGMHCIISISNNFHFSSER